MNCIELPFIPRRLIVFRPDSVHPKAAPAKIHGRRPRCNEIARSADSCGFRAPQYHRAHPLLRLAHALVSATMRRVGAVHGFWLGRAGERRTMTVEIAMSVSAGPIMSAGIRIRGRIARTLAHALLFGAKQLLEVRSCDFGADRAGIG